MIIELCYFSGGGPAGMFGALLIKLFRTLDQQVSQRYI